MRRKHKQKTFYEKVYFQLKNSKKEKLKDEKKRTEEIKQTY